MSKTQESWSKNSSFNSPFEIRQKLFSRNSSTYVKLYGTVKNIQGQESYDSKFNSGLRIQISFSKSELNETYSNTWFPLDITDTDFFNTYGSIDSFILMNSKDKIHCVLDYNPPSISSGYARLTSNIKKVYDNGETTESYSLSTLVSGLDSSESKTYRTIKPVYSKDVNTGIKLSDKKISIAATGKNFIELTDSGLSLSGSLNMQMNPSAIKYGGFVSPQDFYRGMIPSTSTSPNATYSPNLPIDTILSLAKIAKIVSSLMV